MALYDVVLFDVDGTLLDSAPGIINTIRETFEIMGIDPGEKDLHQYVGPPLRKTYAEFLDSDNAIEEAVSLFRKSYEIKGSHECSEYQGVRVMLERLKEAGVRMFTATSKPTPVVEPILDAHDLTDFFDAVVGASVDRVRDTKEEVIQYVIRANGLSGKRILMVGDRADDLAGARACGIHCAYALYGYGNRTEAEAYDPVYYAESCEKLADFILNENQDE